MTTSSTHPKMEELTPASNDGRRRAGRFIAGILCTVAALTYVIHNAGSRPPAAQPAVSRSVSSYGPGSPYAPGGSVYDEQVPAAARQVTLRALAPRAPSRPVRGA